MRSFHIRENNGSNYPHFALASNYTRYDEEFMNKKNDFEIFFLENFISALSRFKVKMYSFLFLNDTLIA